MSLTTTGGALVPQSMEAAIKFAEMMARAKMVPAHLQGQVGDCLMVVEQAGRWGMSPFAVAQCTSVIQGRLMYEGKLVAAALHTSGALATRLSYDYTGEGNTRTVRVSATLAGETTPRCVDVKAADARTTNKMWTTQLDQQLAYHGARVWARRYAPEVMLGVYAPEEMEPAPQQAYSGPTIEAVAVPETPQRTTNGRTPRQIIEAFQAVKNAQDYYDIIDNDGERIAKLKELRPAAFEQVEDARKAAAERMEETPVTEAPAAAQDDEA
jgi:hypothetical protein